VIRVAQPTWERRRRLARVRPSKFNELVDRVHVDAFDTFGKGCLGHVGADVVVRVDDGAERVAFCLARTFGNLVCPRVR
jgi:hypothetical protein